MARHGARETRMGGGSAGAQLAPAGRRDRRPAGARIRRHARHHVGFHPVDEAHGGERRVPVGA
eukprot:4707558-Pleurochrysis_carterae.AAC.1